MKNQILVLVLVVVSISTVACGRKAGGMDLDPELSPYVYEFLGESASHGVDVDTSDLTVKFVQASELSGNGDSKVGTCAKEVKSNIIQNGDFRRYTIKTVKINQDYFNYLKKQLDSEYVKINLREAIFHELGHCLLNRKHDDRTMTDTSGGIRPASIMNSYSQAAKSPNYVASNWTVLTGELFTNIPR